MNDQPLHHITIECHTDEAGVIRDLRERARAHIRSELRMSLHSGHRFIELLTDDVDSVREALDGRMENGTSLTVEVPGPRSASDFAPKHRDEVSRPLLAPGSAAGTSGSRRSPGAG